MSWGKQNEKMERRMLFCVLLNCSAEFKNLLIALFITCSFATILHFTPARCRSSISTFDLRFCISKIPKDFTNSNDTAWLSSSFSVSSLLPNKNQQVTGNSTLRRVFEPYGAAAYNFILMGAYRGGLSSFAIVGLSSKPLHLYSKPSYLCEWVWKNDSTSITTVGYKILPDWGYGRVYTVVIVNCTFLPPINADNSGGKLFLLASTSGGGDKILNITNRFEVLSEFPKQVNFTVFASKPKYEYLYCGSPLYGNLSPQRVREWIAYHVRLFGEKSHFVIHDAGGIHDEIKEVLKPWMELGYVSLQDVRDQERFDGYYHNQFLVVNDCLHRYKFMALWMFFFDTDEFVYVPPKYTIATVLNSFSAYNQLIIEQVSMSNKLCLSSDSRIYHRKWGFEKLVYRDANVGIRRDRKYAIQPRNVYATGVHMSQNLAGRTTYQTEGKIMYFHYHGTIGQRREPCRKFTDVLKANFENNSYILDSTMRDIAWAVKKFEHQMIGSRLSKTRQ